jgi:hypothetical protein
LARITARHVFKRDVYINPVYVVSMRPDPEAPSRMPVIKLSDGDTVRVNGDHEKVADRLARIRPV